MVETGILKMHLDSAMLKDNVAQSIGDVLGFGSSLFVKNYGRATLSTVSFRGTSPSHTQVTWNGLRINSPMLGMTDFSTIPSYFIDQANLYYGASSTVETGGGLGGLVSLATSADAPLGTDVRYIQGAGSFKTFDEFLRASYRNERLTISTRLAYSSSPNDYTFINHDKKENIYGPDHEIIGQYHPKEKNRSGAYHDLHLLQEVYFTPAKHQKLGLNVWFSRLDRELPMLTTDYGDEREFENKQLENTLRAVASWKRSLYLNSDRYLGSVDIRGGWINTRSNYHYRREVSEDNWSDMTNSHTLLNTLYGQASATVKPWHQWQFSASGTVHQHFARSYDRNVMGVDGNIRRVGFSKDRCELSGSITARWQPTDRLGMSASARGERFGVKTSPFIPTFMADYKILKANAMANYPLELGIRGSVTRNYRFPTINDLYFMPGGNPKLKSERGVSYDCGVNVMTGKSGHTIISASVTWFDSHIKNWILWLPTTKGYFSARNVKDVHSYGIEGSGELKWQPAREWLLDLKGSASWTPSINEGEKMSDGDISVGKQLPYQPRFSASLNGRLSWKSWAFVYKWCHYSRRYTMSSNDSSYSGQLPEYYMSNISLEKELFVGSAKNALNTDGSSFTKYRGADLQLKLAVNNLFNEDYISVLSHPMPGINFEFFISISPKW